MPDTAETAHIKAPRSMAHLLRTTLMAVGILSLLLSVVGAALLFQHAFAEQFDTDLSRTVEAIAVGMSILPTHSQSSWPSMQTACV